MTLQRLVAPHRCSLPHCAAAAVVVDKTDSRAGWHSRYVCADHAAALGWSLDGASF